MSDVQVQSDARKDTPAEGTGRAAAAATFQTFVQFLQELSSADSAGRVLLTKTGGMPYTASKRRLQLTMHTLATRVVAETELHQH